MTQEFSRFTDRARKVICLAEQEARRLGAAVIDTEHVLLGLLVEGAGVAANVLQHLGLDLTTVRSAVDRIAVEHAAASTAQPAAGQSPPWRWNTIELGMPLTDAARRTMDASLSEAANLNHNYIGTEHLLLGLLSIETGAAHEVLTGLGLTPANVREEVLNLLGAS